MFELTRAAIAASRAERTFAKSEGMLALAKTLEGDPTQRKVVSRAVDYVNPMEGAIVNAVVQKFPAAERLEHAGELAIAAGRAEIGVGLAHAGGAIRGVRHIRSEASVVRVDERGAIDRSLPEILDSASATRGFLDDAMPALMRQAVVREVAPSVLGVSALGIGAFGVAREVRD